MPHGDSDMSDFVRGEGLPFFAHLLKRLSDEFVRACTVWYPEAGLTIAPRCASTVRALYRLGPLSVTELAAVIRQSHPLAINWVRDLKALGFVTTSVDPQDRRRTLVQLTDAGLAEAELCCATDESLKAAYLELMADADAPVFEQLWRIEEICRSHRFEDRLRAASRAAAPPSTSGGSEAPLA